MSRKRIISLSLPAILGLALVLILVMGLQLRPVAGQESDESVREAEKSVAAEQASSGSVSAVSVNPHAALPEYPLFVGLDNVTVPAYRIDVVTNNAITVFVGVEVWGATYDYLYDQVFFSEGAELWVWPVGGTPTLLGIVHDSTDAAMSMVGLGYYEGKLYASRSTGTGDGEGIYLVDPNSLVGARVIAYPEPSSVDLGGFDIDPITGIFYGTNDDPELPGLVQIDPDGTVTVLAPYPDELTDVDGLAVGDGDAYLITDEPAPPDFNIFDLVVLTYTGRVSNPWTTSDTFAGGAWIEQVAVDDISCNGPAVSFLEGIPATWTIVDNTGGSGIVWVTTADSACEQTNLTNGRGDAACADSAAAGSGAPPYDTELLSNLFDLTNVVNAQLDLKTYYRDMTTPGNDLFRVDIWDGSSWTNLLTRDESHEPEDISLSLDAFVGKVDLQIRFRYSGDGWDYYAQVDDVSLSCEGPDIELQKTVGTDPNSCATGDQIYVAEGSEVYYCYEVSNTGSFTLFDHNLVDSQIGTIFNGLYELAPGTSYAITVPWTITSTTVNTATWMACDQQPGGACGQATDTAVVNTVQPASFPTCTGFKTGSLPSYFYPQTSSNGSAKGRVRVTTDFPHSGLYGLDIDTDCDGCDGPTLQSAVMVIDLAGQNKVELDFWVHEHGDEDDPEDGLFISDDGGVTWAQIMSLNGFPISYQRVELDLVAATADAGMSLVDGFQIKFQSLDDFMIDLDGYSFDDICVQEDLPEIILEKTVGFDPAGCATADDVAIPTGTEVFYCYKVTNTGNFTLSSHDIVDSELGIIADDYRYDLSPDASTWLTKSAAVDITTVNTATWTAYTPGMSEVTSDTDSAIVDVVPAALIDVNPVSLHSQQAPNVQFILPLTISNVGDSALEWELSEKLPASIGTGFINESRMDAEVAPASHTIHRPVTIGDELFQIDAETSTGSAVLLGVEYVDGEYWVTAGGITTAEDPNYLYQLDSSGSVIDSWLQSTTSLWGWRDLAYDGTYLYTSDSAVVEQIDPETGQATGITIPCPDNPCRAMAYDPATDHFWTKNFSGPLYEFDRTGAVVNSFTNALATYGAAWDTWSPGGPFLWLWSQDGPAPNQMALATQIDPGTGDPTGVSFLGSAIGGSSDDNLAGGATINPDIVPGMLVFAGLHQAPSDTIVGYDLDVATCGGDLPWMSGSPTKGSVAPNGDQVVNVTFNSSGLATGLYSGTLCIKSNDFYHRVLRLPVELEVISSFTFLPVILRP